MNVVLPTAPRRSLVDFVEGELRNALVEGRLEPGTRLITRDLAKTLRTSVTPVREALVRLVAAGALTAEPAQAFRVPILSRADYVEISEVRMAVEGLAAATAAKLITPKQVEELEELLPEYLEARVAGDSHLALQRNKIFRFAVYSCANMPHLMQVIEMLWLKTGPGFNYLYPQQRTEFVRHRNYETLLAALRARHPAGAKAAIEAAINDGTDMILIALSTREAEDGLLDGIGSEV